MENAFATFLLEKGLYDEMKINEDNISDLIDLIAGRAKISTYCKKCKENRVFTMKPIVYYTKEKGSEKFVSDILANKIIRFRNELYGPDIKAIRIRSDSWMWSCSPNDNDTRLMVFEFVCTMEKSHHMDFVVLTDNHTLCKIGQYPSVADLSFPELDTYRKVLSEDNRKEFGRAIGLYANGIGAGSYVYLRRIFENLLAEAKDKAGDNVDDEAFRASHVNEKITLLKDYLPNTLTENSVLYGILSKGIHELSEDECLAYFPVVKDCIYMILDEWESMRRTEEAKKRISTELNKIASK